MEIKNKIKYVLIFVIGVMIGGTIYNPQNEMLPKNINKALKLLKRNVLLKRNLLPL